MHKKLEDPRFDCTNAMLCWTPGTANVKLVPWPDTIRASDAYRSTTLACNSYVHGKNFEQRKAIAFIEAVHLIVRDKVDAAAVHNTMLDLEEYRDGCAEDMLREF
ncbi:hypothetical protein [Thermomonas fusca]|uniref:hypothetical protein n=1 Tax=Thermomonas fusca TaxID=215690 RepID=UPI0012EC960A|nr:hypothetical protein [Thermomonas fusca]